MTGPLAVDDKVVYRAPHVRADEPGEEGVVTGFSRLGAFVRFGNDVTSRLCFEETLTRVALS